MGAIKKYLSFIFGYTIRLNPKPYIKHIYEFFVIEEFNYMFSITNIEVYETNIGLKINIKTNKPGILIGKHGSFLNKLDNYLKDQLKRDDIIINIIECKLWNGLY